MIGGREALRRSVRERLGEGVFAHGVLLLGPRGVGAEETALWIAKASVCEGEGEIPCGGCGPCLSFASAGDLDLSIIRPVDHPVWAHRDDLERHFPEGIGPALEELQAEGFLLSPLPAAAGRRLVPLRFDPAALFRKGRGTARFDRSAFARRLDGSGVGEGAKAFLRETFLAPHSVEWYLSSIGIGFMTGSDEPAATAGRAAVIPFLGRRPAARRRKVVIVEEAERMTEEAQNALLKTLEEPPPDSLLLLTCSRREGLLDTIRSRCEQVKIGSPGPAERAEAAGRFFVDIAPDEWEALLLLGEGAPGQAAEFDLELLREEREQAESLLRSAEGGSLAAFFPDLESWVDGLEEGGENEFQKAARLLSLFLVVARERAVEASAEGGGADLARARRLFRAAHGALASIRPGANLRLLLEEFGVNLWRSAAPAEGDPA
ncbi:MAG: hypothetical protein ABIK65_08670 [Candidatus Eisenbacteria bacterium]